MAFSDGQSFDLNSPEAYYAAGLMQWASANSSQSPFAVDDLHNWYDSNTFDVESDKYFADAVLLAEALKLLSVLEGLSVIPDRYGPTMLVQGAYRIRDFAQAYPDSIFARANQFGSRWMRKALIAVTEERQNVPAVEPTDALDETTLISADGEVWEPLPLTKGAEAQQALAEIADTVAELKSDNGFSATYPAERDNMVSFAEATIAVMNDGRVTRDQVRHNIIGAGRWLVRIFPDTTLGQLGEQLMSQGRALLAVLGAKSS